MPPYFFQQDHLELFGLDAENFSFESVRTKYRRYVLTHHPDKGGTNERCALGNNVYTHLLQGFHDYEAFLNVSPGATLAQTVRPTPRLLPTGISSAAQHAPPAPDLASSPDLAPTFHAEGDCHLYPTLEEALQQMHFLFNSSCADMADILKQAPVGTDVTFYKVGAVQPDPIRFHGTSFNGMCAISARGFLPVWGAGRGQALEKFGQDLPVVYTSSDLEVASWYPLAMVDAKGNRVGERVSNGHGPMRVVLICDASDHTKRIKIRRKKNKQDAWLPGDIEVRGVISRMMKDAVNPEAGGRVGCKYPVNLESSDEEASEPEQHSENEMASSSDDSSESWFTVPQCGSEPLPKRLRPRMTPPSTSAAQPGPEQAANILVEQKPFSTTTAAQRGAVRAADIKEQQIKSLVPRQCMLLRIHRDDPRYNADIAYDYLQLVRLRHQYVRRKQLDWEAPLSKEDQKAIWKEELYWWFLSERPEETPKTYAQLRAIFRVWQRFSFGNVQAIRDILRNSCCWATWRHIEFLQNVMTTRS